MVNLKCFSLVDLLHRLYCMVITVMSANKHGWMLIIMNTPILSTVINYAVKTPYLTTLKRK